VIKDKIVKPAVSDDEQDKRTRTETSFQSMNEEDLLLMLKVTKSLHDEADILQQLHDQLAAVRARIDTTREAHIAIDTPLNTHSESLTTQLPEE
jgi:hypothetical protein